MGNAAQGMFAIGTTLQQERYGDDLGSDEEYWFNKYMEQSNELGNAALIRTFVGEAKNTVQYLLDHDHNVYLSKDRSAGCALRRDHHLSPLEQHPAVRPLPGVSG